MKFREMFLGGLLFFSCVNLNASYTLDQPIVVGLISNLAFENSFKASLICFAHWVVKNKPRFDQQSAAQELIGYILGSALGQCIRPEIRMIWRETRRILLNYRNNTK